jgi:hypothetical protein
MFASEEANTQHRVLASEEALMFASEEANTQHRAFASSEANEKKLPQKRDFIIYTSQFK